MHTGM